MVTGNTNAHLMQGMLLIDFSELFVANNLGTAIKMHLYGKSAATDVVQYLQSNSMKLF